MKHTACGEELERLLRSLRRGGAACTRIRAVWKRLSCVASRQKKCIARIRVFLNVLAGRHRNIAVWLRLVSSKRSRNCTPNGSSRLFSRHLCMDYGFHTAASIRFEYARPMPRIDAALSIFGYRVSHRLMSIWKERQTLRGFAKRFWSLLSMPLSTLRCLRLTAR